MKTIETAFVAGSGRCNAWLTLPDGDGPFPAVLLVHGFGATHEMALPHYERSFAAAGMAVAAFDFRRIGASPGEPRQRMRVGDMLIDTAAALDWLMAQATVDRGRVALWGTSFGASHAMVTAARRKEVAAVVVNCPMIDCWSAAARLGVRHMLRLAQPIASDLIRGMLGLTPRYLPLVVEPGELGLINVAGARAGWHSIMPPGMAWDNRAAAAIGFDMLRYRAIRVAGRIDCPFLVCVSDRETLMDPAIAAEAARRAPRGRAIHYDADHFEVYHPPLVERIVADQTAFLQQTLSIASPARILPAA